MKKPRIAIYYHTNFGRNDGPPLYYKHAMEKYFDLDVVHLMPDGDTRMFGKFDLHFWVDYGEDGLPIDHSWTIPKDGGKSVYVCSDAHIDQKGRDYRYNLAKKFDYVFFNQLRFVDEYKRSNVNEVVEWLPHAAEPSVYKQTVTLKKYDVCFIGHFQNVPNYNSMTRTDALDRLFKEFPNFYFGTRNPMKPGANMFEDAANKFCQSKIVFNISIKDDVNMRVFETLSTGSFLLTNRLPTLPDLFEDGKHLVMYDSYDDMIEKARYYIEHEEEREEIAERGRDEFINHHTYAHRIAHILEIAGYKVDLPDIH